MRGEHRAGLRAQRRMRRRLVIRKPIEVREGNRSVRVVPSRDLKLSCEIEYPHPAIGHQSLQGLRIRPERFARRIAPARTFGFLSDVQQLQANGLALGGAPGENAVVFDGADIICPGGLRHADEPVRHKMLDAVGDLALAGGPILGRWPNLNLSGCTGGRNHRSTAL